MCLSPFKHFIWDILFGGRLNKGSELDAVIKTWAEHSDICRKALMWIVVHVVCCPRGVHCRLKKKAEPPIAWLQKLMCFLEVGHPYVLLKVTPKHQVKSHYSCNQMKCSTKAKSVTINKNFQKAKFNHWDLPHTGCGCQMLHLNQTKS